MTNECGHPGADYVVMECGDPTEDGRLSEPSGCYESFFVCQDCIKKGDDQRLAEEWWAKHREVCPVGHVVLEQVRQRFKNALTPFVGQTVTPQTVDDMVAALRSEIGKISK